jgi:hypothetical protein
MSMIGELRQVPATLIPALHDKAARKAALEAVMDSAGLTVDKAWDGLTGLLEFKCTNGPLEGVAVYGVDTGYGPPQLVTPDEVQLCARELSELSEDDLREAYDPDGMAADGRYPDIWDRADERDGNLDWLLAVFREVRAFYQDAAQRGNGVLFFLT